MNNYCSNCGGLIYESINKSGNYAGEFCTCKNPKTSLTRIPDHIVKGYTQREESRAKEFEKELVNLINRYSRENLSDTPDHILAEYLINCLNSFNSAVNKRTDWYK